MGDFQNHGVSKQLFDSSGNVKDIRPTPFKKAQGSMETDTVSFPRTLHDGRWQLMITEFEIEQQQFLVILLDQNGALPRLCTSAKCLAEQHLPQIA